jgi:hypothetical protein
MNAPRLALIAILVLILASYQQAWLHRDSLYETADISTASLNTGDILIFNSPIIPHYKMPLIHKIGGSVMNSFNYACNYYGHAGIVIKINDKPYIYHLSPGLEYDSFTQKYANTEPKVVPMECVNAAYGKCYAFKCRRVITHTTAQLHDILNKYANTTYQTNVKSVVLGNLLKMTTHTGPSYLCTDHVEKILQELNIISNTKNNADINDILQIIKCGPYNKVPILLI